MKLKNYLLQIAKNKNNKKKENICLYGISQIIKELYLEVKGNFIKKTIKKISSELKIPYQTLYSWISGSNPIPILKAYQLLKFWKENCNRSEREFIEKWNLIYKNNRGLSQNGQRRVILPLEFNGDLAYLMGFFQGDGHLKKENTKGFQEYSLYFYDGNVVMLHKINNLLKEEFGIKGNIYIGTNKKGHRWYVLRISSKPIYNFFRNVLNLKRGKKVREIETPEIIKKSTLNIQLLFIRGFFDAEGGVGKTSKTPWLDIGQASKKSPCEILVWIRERLKENGVILSEPKRTKNQEFFRIRTSKRETIKRFFEIISSNHPEKISKFKTVIERCPK